MAILKHSVHTYFLLLASPISAFLPSSSFGIRRSVLRSSKSDEFTVGVLGDLHMDPRDLQDYDKGRNHLLNVFKRAPNPALVSLGDLGESKVVEEDSSELYSGTTRCHQLAASYLKSFGVPYELVGGNHDLEGIDEFATDKENLKMMLEVHNKPTPQFIRKIADKTLLVGLTSTVFRDAVYTSHEVTIDEEQITWFEQVLKDHPAQDGWKIFVFSHAPPLGSGLKVLPENHVVNGCCWLNHSNEEQSRRFIELVRQHRSIKAWFSGHFHLGQNYQQSITLPDTEDRGSCVFVQTSVMRSGTSRDGSQQSRLIRGNADGFDICTIDHQRNGKVRLDASVTYSDCDHEVGVYANDDSNNDTFEQVYDPIDTDEDALYPSEDDLVEYDDFMVCRKGISEDTTAWWYLKCGRVLGIYKGNLFEYDLTTLAPIGLVVSADELVGKRIAIINAATSDEISSDTDTENGDDPVEAVVLMDEKDGKVVVVQPNEDGSYWRKIVRNKIQRMQEVQREQAASKFAKEILNHQVTDVVSTWGPYTTTSGTAKTTAIEGLTVPGPAEVELESSKQVEFEKHSRTVPFATPTPTPGSFNMTRLSGLSM